MSRVITDIAIIITAALCCPAIVWARDVDDLAGSVVSLLYNLVIGLLLICFIVYSIVKLKSKRIPVKRRGAIVFTISIISIAPTVIIPMSMIRRHDWTSGVIEAMLVFYGPILVLTIISAVLAKFVMSRSPALTDDSE